MIITNGVLHITQGDFYVDTLHSEPFHGVSYMPKDFKTRHVEFRINEFELEEIHITSNMLVDKYDNIYFRFDNSYYLQSGVYYSRSIFNGFGSVKISTLPNVLKYGNYDYLMKLYNKSYINPKELGIKFNINDSRILIMGTTFVVNSSRFDSLRLNIDGKLYYLVMSNKSYIHIQDYLFELPEKQILLI